MSNENKKKRPFKIMTNLTEHGNVQTFLLSKSLSEAYSAMENMVSFVSTDGKVYKTSALIAYVVFDNEDYTEEYKKYIEANQDALRGLRVDTVL